MPVEIEVAEEFEWVLYFAAVIINVIGNFIDSIGWCLQKQSHVARLSDVSSKDDAFITDKSWCKGFAFHTFGNKFAKISYAFGPASLLLPLDTLKIVWTTLFAHKYLNEKIGIKEIIGLLVIICGAVISTVFGPKPKESYYTIQDIVISYQRASFLVIAGIISFVAFTDYVMLKICTFNKNLIRDGRLFMLSYIFIAAYFSSWNTLFVKQMLELIVSSFVSLDVAVLNWSHWLAYITIIALMITSFALEYWRQRALKGYSASFVAAIYVVLRIALGILLTSVFFQEFESMATYQLILFIVGIVASFIGVAVVVHGKNDEETEGTEQTKYNVHVNANESDSDDHDLVSEHETAVLTTEL